MYTQYHFQDRDPQAPAFRPQAAPSSGSTVYSSHISSAPSSPTNSIHSRTSGHSTGIGDFVIGCPNFFVTGPHTGKTIRMELHEIQKADLGRKYAKVDRRPLDPPPVILLKIFEVHDAGTDRERETELLYDDTQLLGLVCTVDLFPVPGSDMLPHQPRAPTRSSSAPSNRTTFQASPSPLSSSSEYGRYYYRQTSGGSGPTPNRTYTGYIYPPEGTTDIVHHLDGFPITESSKQTQALVGATFVQPSIIDYQGHKSIVFVFADLAVKIEGTFILRHRVFDIFARPYSQQLTITAEVYGGPFRVFSTKEFPGLAASTELTKLLARWGVRLNIRETERRRRKRMNSEERRSPTPDGDN
ncbi:hypothetical protein BDN70DRAFT_870956 [Pholiota conissans]|uniref:Velvet domain-containing protein n=1 Tax=Pholiota conissans TaxID=109636 RepID=A0A9P6D7A6_9AGAR|nr:hypothetical protein BDN70DRAFT_870956 [Pholiota conissans]